MRLLFGYGERIWEHQVFTVKRRLQAMLSGSKQTKGGTSMNSKMAFTYKTVLIAVTLLVTACGAENVSAATSNLSGPQKNAVRSAKQYLGISGFSRDGLIEQLSSSFGDGYELTDATVAVDSLGVDWNENAVKSAKQYLRISGFSCKGLIEQLSSSAGDKYTVSQATYGARQGGAC